jgi:hypothetical protein
MVGVGSGTTDLRDATLRRALNAPGSRTPEPTWMPNGRTVASAVTVRVAAVDLKSDTAVPLFTVGHSLGEHAFGLLLWNGLGRWYRFPHSFFGDPTMPPIVVQFAQVTTPRKVGCPTYARARRGPRLWGVPNSSGRRRHGDCADGCEWRTYRCRRRYPRAQRQVRVDPLSVALLLHAAEERLDHGIVPAIARSAHTRPEVIGPAEAPPSITAELHCLIGVNDGPPRPALLRG